jgi:hypothetical protein
VLAAQLTHAAGESVRAPLPAGTHAVVLAALDEAALARLEERLALAGIAHVAIREPDPPWSGALMALGLEPTHDRARVRRALGRLPLL